MVARPEDVIGEVDAVIIATDKGYEHVERCRPFVEAGLPVFVDKPLADNEEDLRTFVRWVDECRPIMSFELHAVLQRIPTVQTLLHAS